MSTDRVSVIAPMPCEAPETRLALGMQSRIEGADDWRAFEYGGFIAAAVLIIFGIGAVFMGWNAHNTVHDTLAQEQIVGTPDMTPSAIKTEAHQGGIGRLVVEHPVRVGREPAD